MLFRSGKQIVSLPMFYTMNEKDVERVCAALREVLAGFGLLKAKKAAVPADFDPAVILGKRK